MLKQNLKTCNVTVLNPSIVPSGNDTPLQDQLPQKDLNANLVLSCTQPVTDSDNKGHRPGFTPAQLNLVSFHDELCLHGFTTAKGVFGRIFKSSVNDGLLARLDVPLANPKGKGQYKYLQSKDSGRFFKEFISDPSDSKVVLVEGVYKAFACKVAGFNAIAYSGKDGAFEGNKIHPDLQVLIEKYDSVQILFDIDDDYLTQLQVENNVLRLVDKTDVASEGTKFERKKWRITQAWNRQLGKDADEILANHGKDKLADILHNVVTTHEWSGISALNNYSATHTEATKYITTDLILDLVERHRITFVKAPMGAGKTWSLSAIFKKYDQYGCLIIAPLRTLGRQICKDLKAAGIKIKYRDDISASENWERIVSCLESISEKGKLKIKADGSQLKGKILVIDEVVAVINNLLTGSTISKTRSKVVDLLTALIRNAEKCIYLSADLTDFHCNTVLKLAGDIVDEKDVCKYANTLDRNKFNGYYIGHPTEGVKLALGALAENKQVCICIDSQKTTSTYGTGNLAELMESAGDRLALTNIPEKEVLVIDSDTSTTKDHEAYKVVKLGEKWRLRDKKLVIVSPSVESGFSLTPDEYSPDLMILCHMGCTDPLGIAQLSMRIRNLDVPRFFCFNEHARLNLGGALTIGQAKKYVKDSIEAIEKSTNAKKKDKIFADTGVADVLNLSLKIDCEGLNLEDEYYRLQVIRNLQMKNREFFVAATLRAQGAVIERETLKVTKALEQINAKFADVKIGKHLHEVKRGRIKAEAVRESLAPTITDKEVKAFKEEQALTVEQKDSMSKFYAQKTLKYDDVTVQDLVDKKHGLLEPEELGIWLQEGREYVEFSEQERILRLQNVPLYNSTKLLESENNTIIQQGDEYAFSTKLNSNEASTKVYKQDIMRGAKAHKIHLAEELGFSEVFNDALKNGIAGLFLEDGTEKPILDFVDRLCKRKADWVVTFGWEFRDFKCDPANIFKHVLQEFSYQFSGKNKVRTKTPEGKTKQQTIYTTITSIRSTKSRAKRADALVTEWKAKYERFSQNQMWVAVGRKLMANQPISDLLVKFGQDLLAEAAKRLPRVEYGLSKHSELMIYNNDFEYNIDLPIVKVNHKNVGDFSSQIDSWIAQNTQIGFDTETYESAVHKLYCKIKNDKWYWTNPQTGKTQQIKPGLDQNHNQVRLMQFSDGITTYVIDFGRCDDIAIPLWMKEAWCKIKKLAELNTFVGHNIKFDISSVRKYGLRFKKTPFCTMTATMLLFGDCGAGKVLGGFKELKTLANGKSKEVVSGGYGLKPVMRNLLGYEVDKKEQSSNWGVAELTDSQVLYAAKDAVYPLVLKQRLDLAYENPAQWGLEEFATAEYSKQWGITEFSTRTGKHANLPLLELENKNIIITAEMQFRGVPVNIGKLKDRIAKLEAIKAEIESDWQALKMPCTPQQAKKIAPELNKRYIDRQHPFDPQELAEALGADAENPNLELPVIDKPLTGSNKDVINDNAELPEFMVLKSWRAFNTAITQLSKVLLSAEINNGVCKTEYKPMSGTGRMSCGNEYGLGTPNLQAFIKKAEGKYFGFIPANGDTPMKFWEKPSITQTLNIRDVFILTDATKAFFTEDANQSHARIAVAFGKCKFGKSVLDGIDGHSMFAMMAILAMLADNPNSLNNFPRIKDFVKNLSEDQIRTKQVCADFKKLDEEVSGGRFRSSAKTLFYSVLNGAQADKMKKVMISASGSSVSLAVGKVMFNKFWNLYTGIANYIKKVLAEAEANSVNYGGIEFNITTLPDGTKLAYARKDGELAVTNLIACQWSRCEATALKKVMDRIEYMPKEWGAELINMVHDEVGITCNKEYWQEAYSYTSDEFAEFYNIYLKDFLPCDEPTEFKLQTKTHLYIPVVAKDEKGQPKLDDKGQPEIINLQPSTSEYPVKVGDIVTSTKIDEKTKQVVTKQLTISCEKFGYLWADPAVAYIPTSWADK